MEDTNVLDFLSDSSKLDTSNLIQNPMWNIVSVTSSSLFNSDRYFAYNYYNLEMEDTTFDITIVRRPLYFMMNNVFPP